MQRKASLVDVIRRISSHVKSLGPPPAYDFVDIVEPLPNHPLLSLP